MYYNDMNTSAAIGCAEPVTETRPAVKKSGTGRKLLSMILCGLVFGAAASGAFAGVNAIINRSAEPAIGTVSEASSAAADPTEAVQTDEEEQSSCDKTGLRPERPLC